MSVRDRATVWDTTHFFYRGPLSSCNYDCGYCPFAKRRSTPEELEADRAALFKLERWVTEVAADQPLALLFTPWGEALVRPWYRETILRLSHARNVVKVAVQTNLSGPLDWLADADPAHLGLWVSYHPGEVARDRFLRRLEVLLAREIRFSVGIVGLIENLEEAEKLRAWLPHHVYLWVNAYKDGGPSYYPKDILQRFSELDPEMAVNAAHHPSFGHRCQTGRRSFFVDGRGDVRRCHFVPRVLGNLYRDPVLSWWTNEPCPTATCACYIGYVHLDRLGLYDTYGTGLMERIPARFASATGPSEDPAQTISLAVKRY